MILATLQKDTIFYVSSVFLSIITIIMIIITIIIVIIMTTMTGGAESAAAECDERARREKCLDTKQVSS